MSERELNRIEVLVQVIQGRMTVTNAANLLELSRRQVHRLRKVFEKHDLKVSRETLRKWMQADGLWLSRKQQWTFHQPRLRREAPGELVQINGSDHRWLEDRGPPCALLVFVDDATSRLMQLRFVPSESKFSYFEALELYLIAHGRPVAFYSEKHTVFRVAS